jgi:hypothetical protein
MSVAGIASSLFNYAAQSISSSHHKTQFQQDFLQLGQDIKSGNLAAAQSDLAALEKLRPASSDNSSPITQAFNQLSTDLQSGNTSAAQQDYSTIQQAFQNRAAHMRHHHGGSGGGGDNTIEQLLQQLGQEVQTGSSSQAKQTYATLQQDLQQFAQTNGLSATTGTSTAGSVSVNA